MIAFLIKSALAMALFLAFYHLVLSKEVLFKFNRFYLICSLLFALAIPFLTFPSIFPKAQQQSQKIWDEIQHVPQLLTLEKGTIDQPLHADKVDGDPSLQVSALEISENSFPAKYWWIVIYVLGLALFTSRFVFQLTKFVKLIQTSEKVRKEGVIYVLLKHEMVPFTFLHFLFVPKKDFEAKSIEREIICHEIAHIRQKHTWDILLVEVIRCLFWFNPLVLWYKNAIRLNHEFLADEAVNKTYRNIPSYQWLLFSKVSGVRADLGLSSTFGFSVTSRRLKMMGKKTNETKAFFVKVLTVFGLALIFFLLTPSNRILGLQQVEGGDNIELYEEIISKGFGESIPLILDLRKLDLVSLKNTYHQLPEGDRQLVTEFPFFEEEAFELLINWIENPEKAGIFLHYNTPPQTKQIPLDIWENWKNTKNVTIEVDDKIQVFSVFEKFSPEDFVLFEVNETKAKGFLNKPHYLVKLTTQEGYQEKYVRPRKKVQYIWISNETDFSPTGTKMVAGFSRGLEKNKGIEGFSHFLEYLIENQSSDY